MTWIDGDGAARRIEKNRVAGVQDAARRVLCVKRAFHNGVAVQVERIWQEDANWKATTKNFQCKSFFFRFVRISGALRFLYSVYFFNQIFDHMNLNGREWKTNLNNEYPKQIYSRAASVLRCVDFCTLCLALQHDLLFRLTGSP